MRYETLTRDLRAAIELLGVEERVPIPNFKSEFRSTGSRDFRELYSIEERAKVADFYSDWIDVFGYSF
mgnify:CR=1 FL=1